MTLFEKDDVLSYDVLLKGMSSCDLTFAFDRQDALPSIGQEIFADSFAANPGGIFNIAYALSGLSLRVGLTAALGNDMFSHLIAERMQAAGLSLALTTWVDRPAAPRFPVRAMSPERGHHGAVSTLALGGSGSNVTEHGLELWLTCESKHSATGTE